MSRTASATTARPPDLNQSHPTFRERNNQPREGQARLQHRHLPLQRQAQIELALLDLYFSRDQGCAPLTSHGAFEPVRAAERSLSMTVKLRDELVFAELCGKTSGARIRC